MNQNLLKERIKGALIGCAYGDAIGMPTEMLSREKIYEVFKNEIKEFYPSTDYDFIGRRMLAGEITDDTINTLLVIEMLVKEHGNVNTITYLNYLKNWISKNPEKSKFIAGPSTMRALNAIENGIPINQSGIMGTSNGSSMKISPIGMISHYKNMNVLIDNVERICLPTHNTSIAISGACAIAACVSYVLRESTPNIETMWDIAFEAIEKSANRGFLFPTVSLTYRLRKIRELVYSEDENVVLEEIKNLYGTTFETIDTIPAVLAIVTLCNFDTRKAGEMSALIGGDTDTIGAISCTICGCYNNNIPYKMVEILEKVNKISFDKIASELVKIIED